MGTDQTTTWRARGGEYLGLVRIPTIKRAEPGRANRSSAASTLEEKGGYAD